MNFGSGIAFECYICQMIPVLVVRSIFIFVIINSKTTMCFTISLPIFIVVLCALLLLYHTSLYVRHVIFIDFRKLKFTRLALVSNGIQATSNLVKIEQFAQKLKTTSLEGRCLGVTNGNTCCGFIFWATLTKCIQLHFKTFNSHLS